MKYLDEIMNGLDWMIMIEWYNALYSIPKVTMLKTNFLKPAIFFNYFSEVLDKISNKIVTFIKD